MRDTPVTVRRQDRHTEETPSSGRTAAEDEAMAKEKHYRLIAISRRSCFGI
jgi:hypothetical protein